MTNHRTAPSRFTSTAEPVYTVQASRYNPAEFSGTTCAEIEDFQPVRTRAEAADYVAKYHRRGYWVEVFYNADRELIAGPFDPAHALPRFIL